MEITTRLHTLRKELKPCTSDELQSFIDRVSKILNEKRQQEAELQQKEKERLQLVDKVVTDVLESGVDLDLLVDKLKSEGDTTSHYKMKDKYRYTALDGEVRRWTGQGRTPTPLKELMEANGTSLEDYLVDPE